MKNLLISTIAILGLSFQPLEAKDLVAYFSAQGNTKAVAERIAELTGADIYRIEAAEPYAANPYDDSQRIQDEAYKDLRPAVADAPSQEWIDQYDRIFIGSPCWWHQPAMVVCTFLESYDLSRHVIVPFFTYGATTYLNESMQKIYKCTPNSVHVPETLPEDLDPDDITRPGRPDDAGIDMPGNADGVEGWLSRLGLDKNASIAEIANDGYEYLSIYGAAGSVRIDLPDCMRPNTVEIYRADGRFVDRMSGGTSYSFTMPRRSLYLVSVVYGPENVRISRKIIL